MVSNLYWVWKNIVNNFGSMGPSSTSQGSEAQVDGYVTLSPGTGGWVCHTVTRHRWMAVKGIMG